MNMRVNPRTVRGIVAVRAEAQPDTKKLLDDLTIAFAEFRQANDERIDAIVRGKADVVLDEKVDRINDEITRLKAAIDDQMRAVARLSVGGAGGNESQEELRAYALLFLAAKTGKPVEAVTDADLETYSRYRPAFGMFLRRGGQSGEILPSDVRAELSVGIDSDGGFFVPTEMSNQVIRRLFETTDMRSLATVMSITTDSIEFPVDTNQATSGGWVSEKASRTETNTPRVGTHKIEVHEQYAEPHATQRLLDDAAIDVEAWLAGKIADILTRTENTAFLTGNGVGKPRGILSYGTNATTQADSARSWGVLQYIASGSTSGFGTDGSADDADKLIDMITALKPAYRANARWLMNRATEAAVRKLKDADGRYLVGMGDIREGVRDFLLFGYPISTGEDMPDIASDAFSIAFGDFRQGYMIVDRQGIRVLRDPFTSKPFVKFYTTKRVGGDIINFDAIKLLKFATS